MYLPLSPGRGVIAALLLLYPLLGRAAPIVESLSRGVVAVHQPDGKVFVSWRLLASDPEGTAFNLYRTTAPGPVRVAFPGRPAGDQERGPVITKLNPEPLTGGTWFTDPAPNLDRETAYFVRTLASDSAEGPPSKPFRVCPQSRTPAVRVRPDPDTGGLHAQ
jgi:hypothetical protein